MNLAGLKLRGGLDETTLGGGSGYHPSSPGGGGVDSKTGVNFIPANDRFFSSLRPDPMGRGVTPRGGVSGQIQPPSPLPPPQRTLKKAWNGGPSIIHHGTCMITLMIMSIKVLPIVRHPILQSCICNIIWGEEWLLPHSSCAMCCISAAVELFVNL